MENKRLYKDRQNQMLCGVCAGVAEYFNIDVTLVRLLFVALGFAGGSGLWIYIIAAVIMPDKPM
ncbi:MAG: PspC domain-containing protein [Pygmaiobacter sp.]|jgi:phage shock protein C|nr:PspC domain-containing protein [Pygmaiobacter sp.]MEA5146797.1 PspC domain-containing protein [Candidatus Limiplasma sp.]